MRPSQPPRSAAEFRTHVDAVADRLEGRLGVYVADASAPEDGPLASRTPCERFGSASLVKLPILYALYEAYDGRLEELAEPLPIAAENRVEGAGVLRLFETTTSIEECARAMIAISDNAATNALIDHLGEDRINACADRLGLEGTALRRKMMRTGPIDPAVRRPEGAYLNTVAPVDCARLLGGVYRREGLSRTACDRLLLALEAQNDASMAARYLPADDSVSIAHKTGYLDSVAADAGLLTVGDRTVVYAFCTDRLSEGGRGTDAVAALGDGLYRWLTSTG